jgi:hypothetical protein
MWLRIPRGVKFEAGEAIGTVNEMYHVHLIAGKSGSEMNAQDALELPGTKDSVAPKIENVFLFDENWQPVGETPPGGARIELRGKIRIVARAFDQMDGNASRRKLGVFKLGYQILREDKIPLSDVNWTISFARMPDEDAVQLVYAKGSRSGYTPGTIFDYIITNEISGDLAREGFLDTEKLAPGNYTFRIFAADILQNVATSDLKFAVAR